MRLKTKVRPGQERGTNQAGGCKMVTRKSRSAIAVWVLAAVCLCVAPRRASGQVETVIYNFLGHKNGAGPDAPVTVIGSHLDGTTYNGGDFGVGQVYRLMPQAGQVPWTFARLFSFSAGGVVPFGNVTPGKLGTLHGTLVENGPNGVGCGVVYELVPPPAGQTGWTENILYQFTCGSDGFWPHGDLAKDSSGTLYGVTKFGGTGGCGTVFRLTPPASGQTAWSFATIYTFAGGPDGCTPLGHLLVDPVANMIFGTTSTGGQFNLGTVYGLTPTDSLPYAKTGIHDFEGDATDAHDGANPNGGLVGGAGNLWGTTNSGGASIKCCGIVFQLRQLIAGNPLYTLIIRHQFTGGQDGAIPQSGLYKDTSGRYWGTTVNGGSGTIGANFGTIFEFYPDAIRAGVYHYVVAYAFNGGTNDGAYPFSMLTADTNGVFYGTTRNGGTADFGTVFSFVP